MRRVHLYRDEEWIAGPLDVPTGFFARAKGLLGRDGLPDRGGMVLERCGMIHTCFMKFSIDAVFLSAAGTVLKVKSAVAPFRVAGALFASTTVELPAGLASVAGVAPGQILTLRQEGPSTGGTP